MIGRFTYSPRKGGLTHVSYESPRGEREALLCVLRKVEREYFFELPNQKHGPFPHRYDAAQAYLEWRETPAVAEMERMLNAARGMAARPRCGNRLLTEDEASAIFTILVEECGAAERDRSSFIIYHTSEVCTEFRFMGHIGFGGKFRNSWDRWYADCYVEEIDIESRKSLAHANVRLEALYLARNPS